MPKGDRSAGFASAVPGEIDGVGDDADGIRGGRRASRIEKVSDGPADADGVVDRPAGESIGPDMPAFFPLSDPHSRDDDRDTGNSSGDAASDVPVEKKTLE